MNKPVIIDCQYVFPNFAASYLILEGEEAAFIDNNTSHSIPILLDSLQQAGLSVDQVRYIIITHVHLDHAGGSSALMEMCSNATLIAHPRAAPHMINPTKLIQSAEGVYGHDKFIQLYGKIQSIDSQRVKTVQDEEELFLGKRLFRFYHTRGHANHHICIWDSGSNGIFTGDAFGLAYPALQTHGLLIFPSTSPTDFSPSEAKLSIQRLLSLGAQSAYLTHFGEIKDLDKAANMLLTHLEKHEEIYKKCLTYSGNDFEMEKACYNELEQYFHKLLNTSGFKNNSEAWNLIELDVKLNAEGIAYSARKARLKNG